VLYCSPHTLAPAGKKGCEANGENYTESFVSFSWGNDFALFLHGMITL